MCKICTLLSYGLCGAIRWPLTRARAALTQQGNTLRLPYYAQHFLSSFRRGRCLHRPARETWRVAGHVGPVLHSAALPEPGGQGRPLLQGERIPTPVCALVRNDRVNFWGVIVRPVTDVTGLGDPFPPALQKEVTLRPPLNFCLRGGAYSSSSWPTRAICSSSSCFCTPHKMAEHFAGSPRRISILGGSEFRLRQGFAVQNAWCGAKAAGRNSHGRSLLLLQLAHQSNMQFVQLLLHSPQNGGAFCGVPSQDFNPRRK